VNVAVGISGVEAAVFLRELPDGEPSVKLAQQGKDQRFCDCKSSWSGGHGNAAGCTLEGPLSGAVDEILGSCGEA